MPVELARSVCVFCGSRAGRSARYGETAQGLGRALAEGGYRLVYGAGEVGLMGEVARAALAAGGNAFGVVPRHLIDREQGKRDLRQLVVTETMHERKKVMFMNADAIVALPGGPGTLDELFEVLTWRQLGLHAKPVYLLNVDGYWDPLLALIEHILQEGFAERAFGAYLEPVATVPALMVRLDVSLAAKPEE